tara:strand:+ start:2620 stop:3438 length:819 start_codon:yes stop_codon:yes gene_type:complete
MPELPEVETLRQALVRLIQGKCLEEVLFHRSSLRFPIPRKQLSREMKGQTLGEITRKGKYLLFHFPSGAMLLHLGMSGRMMQSDRLESVEVHTHATFHFSPDVILHFIDPRRFGCILWVPSGHGHFLLNHLGPDPFESGVIAERMKRSAYKCKGPIKAFLMNAKRIAGVGNIYACEALFQARINPNRPANRLSLKAWETLLNELRKTLKKSIASGGTTLRDFFNPEGKAGYFAIELNVYGREGKPCPLCQKSVRRTMRSGRSTFFCPNCQMR